MATRMFLSATMVLVPLSSSNLAVAQAYGKPDRDGPADPMVQEYLAAVSHEIHETFLDGVRTAEDWWNLRRRYKREYLHMLGLWPLPEKTPLRATVTGVHQGDRFVVEKLHYQSRPGLYVTANLYRPTEIAANDLLPAVLYVCGHSGRGRNGNKTAFQSHGMWFARHGYVCLVTDTLQLGEIGALHHGTYREKRWWWHSRGYTPAGVECWNGVRGIDYLISRKDVDADRIAVTGISGGGAATFWVAAADERVKVAVPVSGMADLPSYVENRVINGHCDCMFLYNTFQWPWARIAALIAPRPLLFVNSDHDAIFPMDANYRITRRLEHLYRLFGAGDLVDSVVSVGGHAYRRDLRRAIYRFINIHLKNDPRLVDDSEVDLVEGRGRSAKHPIPPEELRVFPRDEDIPKDELNTTIDEHFVPLAKVPLPGKNFAEWKSRLVTRLKEETSFRIFPERVPPAEHLGRVGTGSVRLERLETEEGMLTHLRTSDLSEGEVRRLVLLVSLTDAAKPTLTLSPVVSGSPTEALLFEPRGGVHHHWTRKNPPNYVERSHVLLGHTVDTGRVRDVIAAARYLREQHDGKHPVYVAGEDGAGILAAYAALLEPEISGVILLRPPLRHMDPGAPQFLNILRVCDIPDVLGMLAPRELVIVGVDETDGDALARVKAIYKAAGASEKLRVP